MNESVVDHDDSIQNLLFINSTWHALVKLRMHTDTTIMVLRLVTTRLGEWLRYFQVEICPSFHADFTPAEVARKERARAKVNARREEDGLPPLRPWTKKEEPVFNLSTSKIHDLGHFADFIDRFGTQDGAGSTEIVRVSSSLLLIN